MRFGARSWPRASSCSRRACAARSRTATTARRSRRANWSKSSLYTALAVTSARVVVASERGKTVDCPRDQDGLEVSTEGPDRLLLAFDAAKLAPDRSGRVEVRLRLPDAQRAVAAIGKPSTTLKGV